MIRILDRYLIREIALPFFLGLILLTFVLEIPPILRDAEALIAKGVLPYSVKGEVKGPMLQLPYTLKGDVKLNVSR